jgi:hypothetical protein
MQRVFIGPSGTVNNSNELNCTANDISIAKAISAQCDTTQPGCIDANTCSADDTFTLIATFQVDVTSNSRYDAAFFFRIDGGANARGDGSNVTGQCSVSQLNTSGSPGQPLDGDTCGDLNAGTFTNVTFTIPDVLCKDSGNGQVILPNCTSWHNNQGTACTLDANVFDANPDTKSKCVCDDTFTVAVSVRKPEGSVTKTATQALVTYHVVVTNSGTIDSQLTVLNDSSYGDITKDKNNGNPLIESTSCVTGGTITKNGGTYPCDFTVKYTTPGTVGDHLNTVTATLHDPAHPTNDVNVNGSTTINVNLNVSGP